VEDSLTVVDISNPASPSTVEHISGAGSPNYLDHSFGVHVSGGYAFLTGYYDDSLTIFDVSDYVSLEFLEDASLNLSTYGLKLDNFQAFLRAHDGVELHDLETALAAYNLREEDFAGWLGAYLEGKADFGTTLETWATQYKNLATDFDVKGQSIESLMSCLKTVKTKYKNLAVLLSAMDGTVLKDLAAFFSVTDGSALKDMGLYLKVIQSIPAFRSITAQRVSSIVHEVS
jgi:hypothetical protein